jgi:DNA modification methylase
VTIQNQTIRIEDYSPHPANYNRHSDDQIRRIAKSLSEFGQVRSVVIWCNYFLAGHGVREAALSLGWTELRADVLPDDWSEKKALAYLVADNELARRSDPDQAQLAAILQELERTQPQLREAAGFAQQELEQLLRQVGQMAEVVDVEPQMDRAEELRQKWQVRVGDLWALDEHRIVCGDCTDVETWRRLLGGIQANGIFTSPPYAEQRKVQYGGIPVGQYVDWWEAVQDKARANLAEDGSFFVNIKPHTEDGERSLYVMDMVLAMARRWGWSFVDEFCWLRGGVPREVKYNFKNGFEPIYHFAVTRKGFKFRPEAVRHESDSVPIPGGPGQPSRAGAAFNRTLQGKPGMSRHIFGTQEIKAGLAYPSNVLKANNNDAALGHEAAFPVALLDFFLRAFSDPGDVWVDPFLGSGTIIMAAHQNGRRGMGIELLPKYVAVALERWHTLTGRTPELLEGGSERREKTLAAEGNK